MPSRILLVVCFAVGQLACESSSSNNDGSVNQFDGAAGAGGFDSSTSGAGGLDAAGGTAGDTGVSGGDTGATGGDTGVSSLGDGGAVDGGGGDAAAATFTQVYAIISNRCSPCHTTATGIGVMQGHLDMTSQMAAFMNLVNAPAAGIACTGKGTRVTPGMPDSSVMYLKISLDDPAPCGSKMPLGRDMLPKAEADAIESWIMSGAMNN